MLPAAFFGAGRSSPRSFGAFGGAAFFAAGKSTPRSNPGAAALFGAGKSSPRSSGAFGGAARFGAGRSSPRSSGAFGGAARFGAGRSSPRSSGLPGLAFGAGRSSPRSSASAAGPPARFGAGRSTPSNDGAIRGRAGAGGGGAGGFGAAGADGPTPSLVTRKDSPHFGQRMFIPLAGKRRSSSSYGAEQDGHSTLIMRLARRYHVAAVQDILHVTGSPPLPPCPEFAGRDRMGAWLRGGRGASWSAGARALALALIPP